ncbi:MAG: hypothetical protein HY866_01875, partial [Chloroflexi bacterium]|nr:hypothetical protein [Chloroflexota bacterium]
MMDPKPKRKRSPKAASKLSEKLALILAGIIPGLLACGLLVFFASEDSGSSNTADQETAAPDQPVQETVIVPFDEVNPTLTRNEYRGQVRLFIEG